MFAGGSSSILRSALAALTFISSAASTITTAATAIGGGHGQEVGQATNVIDNDHVAQLTGLFVDTAFDREEARLRAGEDAARHWGVREKPRALSCAGGASPKRPSARVHRRGEKEARDAPCQRRLAGAARPRSRAMRDAVGPR